MFLAVAGFQVLTFSTSSSWGGGTKVFPSSSCVCSRGFYGTRGNAGAPERRQWEQTWASGSSQQRGAALILHVSMQLFQRSAKGGMLRGLQLNIASWREPAVCCCFLIPCGRFGRAGVGDCGCWGGESACTRRQIFVLQHFPEISPGWGRNMGGLRRKLSKKGISNCSECKPPPFPALVSVALFQQASPHPFPRDAGGKVCCQSIFIFSSFGRSFIGFSAQIGISDPASEYEIMYALIHLPFPIFKLPKYPCPKTTAPAIEVSVTPGQVKD